MAKKENNKLTLDERIQIAVQNPLIHDIVNEMYKYCFEIDISPYSVIETNIMRDILIKILNKEPAPELIVKPKRTRLGREIEESLNEILRHTREDKQVKGP